MCKRSSEELGVRFLAFVIALLASSFAFAQGSEGRTESFDPSSSRNSKPRIAKAAYQKPAKPIAPRPGKLLLSVNEPASEVSLTRTDDFSVPPQSITTNGPITRSLDAGSYQLSVKKNGYFDETRNLDIAPGEYRTVNVTMRPQMAILTVKTNLGDSEIDIENAGKFSKPLKRHLLMPGTYRITLRRRGYVSQTVTADLSIAGKEQSIYVVLEPLRIDSVLWTANKAIERGELDIATDLVNDVLALNSSHAKANLVRGLIELRRGNETASSYLLKAIDGGETVLLPMRVLHTGQLIDVEFGIDREAISFANEKFLELNFRILRSDLDAFSLAADQDQTPFLTVRGKSDFYGKPIRPDIRLYLNAAIRQPDCSPNVACLSAFDVLCDLFSRWKR